MDLRRFTRADVPAAAALLAARGNTHPLVAPFDAAEEITDLLDRGHEGWVADGGYLLGKPDAHAAWVLYTGHAARDVATYRALYRALGADWVGAGERRHAILVPVGDPVASEAFADLAFGREHVCALAAVADQPTDAPDPRIEIREVGVEEFEALVPLLPVLSRHLGAAPCWSPMPESYYDGIVAEYREDVERPETVYHLASLDGVPVGFATWEPMPPRVRVPAGTWAYSHAAVLPEARGRGVGHALTLAGLAMLRERDVTYTWCDWRLTNMDAEPRWRRYGWTPYTVRYTRRVEPGA